MADLIDPSVGVFMAMALGQLSLTLLFAFSQPFQDLQGAMDSFWPVRQPLEEAEQQRKRHLRHQTFRTWLPWWILANHATTLLFMAIDAGHYWAGDRPFAVASFGGKSYGCYGVVVWGFAWVLRFVFSFGSETSTIRDSVLIFVSFSAVMCLTPSYMQPNASKCHVGTLGTVGGGSGAQMVWAHASVFHSRECSCDLANGNKQWNCHQVSTYLGGWSCWFWGCGRSSL